MRGPSIAMPSERLWLFAAVAVFGLVAVEAAALALFVIPGSDLWSLGMDYRFYRDVGARWVTEGSYYHLHQLAGPYDGQPMVDVFYPPVALALFVPFAYLPAVLWWILPIGLLAVSLARLRPAPWAWLVMAVLLAWPRAIGAYLFGNSDIWAVALVGAGSAWGWPAAFLLFKPTLLPFTAIAVRRRSFWIGMALILILSLPMLPLWLDYAKALSGLRIATDYSFGSVPLLLIPIVAWLGRGHGLVRMTVGTSEPWWRRSLRRPIGTR